MWNIKCFVILIITGATEIASKGLEKDLEGIPGQHSLHSLPKKKQLYQEDHTLLVKFHNLRLEA
jgi:hypothetical protein